MLKNEARKLLKKVKTKVFLVTSPIVACIIYLTIPVADQQLPFSTVINDRNGNLLSASIAADGQWRFPPTDSIPNKLATSILLFEDEHFYRHPGFNPLSIFRALRQNIEAGRVVSGASTITMQVARMMERKDRTLFQKIKEFGIALRLEIQNSKKEILNKYASFAPFGGNVVGINAASWRYYGRPAHLLTWSESATLAVLPNQPGIIYPGTEQQALRKKRDFLLNKIFLKGFIDTLDYQLSLAEPLPERPYDIPQKASHLLTTIRENQEGTNVNTSLDPYWQSRVAEVIERKHKVLKGNGIENLAAMVVDLKSGEVIAYVGNTSDSNADGYNVDVIQRPRSSGSILKPLLYAAAISNGTILPKTLLQDVPAFFGGYSPKNFNYGYEGMIAADQALSKSLNIPFTYLLKKYGYEKFYQDLRNLGITTLNKPPIHYGLTMILGGAEVKLWDLAQAYFSLYRKLANEDNMTISYDYKSSKMSDVAMEEISIWHTFQAMTELRRPGSDQHWESFNSSQLIAWKTGTSFGFRDAWTIGLNGDKLIAIWVGNADGEGRAGLIGSTTAGPILTELIRLADHDPSWLKQLTPYSISKSTCAKSGQLANEYCSETISTPVGTKAERNGICTYHQRVWMDQTSTYLVNKNCYPAGEIVPKTIFVLPPTEGYYYRKMHSDYEGRPSSHPDCEIAQPEVLAINYPEPQSKIFLPRALIGELNEVIMEASHQNTEAVLHWHLNELYLGESMGDHKKSVKLDKGNYTLTIVDNTGNRVSSAFEIISETK